MDKDKALTKLFDFASLGFFDSREIAIEMAATLIIAGKRSYVSGMHGPLVGIVMDLVSMGADAAAVTSGRECPVINPKLPDEWRKAAEENAANELAV